MKKEIMKLVCQGQRPTYANDQAAGLDLRLKSDQPVHLVHGDHAFVHTGIFCQIPSGHFGLIAIRSGLGVKGLMLANGVGIIDEDYRGELRIPLFYHGDGELDLEDGERVAQMIIIPYIQPQLEFVDQLEESERGQSGFGSSGRF